MLARVTAPGVVVMSRWVVSKLEVARQPEVELISAAQE